MMTTKSKTAKPAAAKLTRVERLHAMLQAKGGASVNEIAGAFGARHSCRGLISTSRRKYDWPVTTSKVEGRGVVYSVAAPKASAAPKAKAKASALKAKASPKP
jgi:hypothetical protein